MITVEQIGAILLVFVLLFGLMWIVRRKELVASASSLFASRAGGRMKVVQRIGLTPQHSVFLLEIESRTVVLATYTGGCSVLASSDGDKRVPL